MPRALDRVKRLAELAPHLKDSQRAEFLEALGIAVEAAFEEAERILELGPREEALAIAYQAACDAVPEKWGRSTVSDLPYLPPRLARVKAELYYQQLTQAIEQTP